MSARVLIAGGGVAGLEAAIGLRELAGDEVDVEICSPAEEFVYRPFAVGVPYGSTRTMRYELPRLAEHCGARFRLATIGSVDGGKRRARTHDGEEVEYDHLILATGTRLLWGVSGAVTFWGVADDEQVQAIVQQMRTAKARRVVFTMPAGRSWALPMYELALLAESELAKEGNRDVSLVVVTPEESPLRLFGQRASSQVAELLAERGIEVITGASPVRFDEGLLTTSPGEAVEADAAIALPRMEGRQVAGVPHDSEGFVAVDDHCRVQGMEHGFAVGDVTTFPVKQGGIAAQQADVVAEAIAAEIGIDVEPRPFHPVLRGVLWTGGEPRYLQGWLTGGHGEVSEMTEQPPWPEQDGKIVSRYLTPFLDRFGSLAPGT
jgi:sulfide:quinone oxidoreductase